MALSGSLKRTFGPLALTATTTTNVYNQGSALIFDSIKQLVITNKTAGAVTFSLWLGATGANAAGTELFNGVSIPANTTQSYFFTPGLKMLSTDFLVGGASAGTSLTITGIGEQVVV
jgi:hypothetical protein